jgi:hypothetical protein
MHLSMWMPHCAKDDLGKAWKMEAFQNTSAAEQAQPRTANQSTTERGDSRPPFRIQLWSDLNARFLRVAVASLAKLGDNPT